MELKKMLELENIAKNILNAQRMENFNLEESRDMYLKSNDKLWEYIAKNSINNYSEESETIKTSFNVINRRLKEVNYNLKPTF